MSMDERAVITFYAGDGAIQSNLELLADMSLEEATYLVDGLRRYANTIAGWLEVERCTGRQRYRREGSSWGA
jgi:hypothetical protein